ncbi:MAG: YbhB/YbcL family Raf kinase inhibitor-like protein [Elusimicrobia bacterium]|nr:YbhB/YbcL family Raf kinase inhibitor-like protein [Elusimicrobiota bacterium]
MENKQSSGSAQSRQKFTIFSEDFKEGGSIPVEFTCDGKNISPSLKWEGIPEGAKSFALTVKDPDAPNGTFIHWIVINLPANINGLEKADVLWQDTVQLTNDFGDNFYGGPCPPSGTHRYVFTLYALNAVEIEAKASNAEEVIKEHLTGETSLTGLYKRTK